MRPITECIQKEFLNPASIDPENIIIDTIMAKHRTEKIDVFRGLSSKIG